MGKTLLQMLVCAATIPKDIDMARIKYIKPFLMFYMRLVDWDWVQAGSVPLGPNTTTAYVSMKFPVIHINSDTELLLF